jgi:outer membrane receptor for monomeric catechols
VNGGRNTFTSSGQLPLDEIEAGRLDRYGFIDPTQGGRVWSGTAAGYLHHDLGNGAWLKADAFLGRSLFDLFSNFTYFLNDAGNGDGIQQHDSRLQQGANLQYVRPNRLAGLPGLLTIGGNFHANQINVGLFPRIGRNLTGSTTHANAHVTNGAGYAQESVSLVKGKLQLMGGLRYDEFRFDVRDRLNPAASGAENSGRWQPKAAVAFTPSASLPLTFHANYGRGISTADARVVVQRPESTRIATTDFYQVGTSHRLGRMSASTDLFLIDRSNELVYAADDGTFEFQGRSRAYGFESKVSFDVTRRIAVNAGVTKVGNVFYREMPRVYVTNAPRFVANAGIIVSAWKGWSGSLRMRAVNHYRLDGSDPSIRAAGHTLWDFGIARQLRRGVDFNVTVDNLTNRDYYETQNYYESRLPEQSPKLRIHATPGYPLTAMVGLTVRFGGK